MVASNVTALSKIEINPTKLHVDDKFGLGRLTGKNKSLELSSIYGQCNGNVICRIE
jgi:hypothetical protein